jgi:2-polyprenyl-6-methoxyphenol hydroxylase-like FAD-dependent oxidoreductase
VVFGPVLVREMVSHAVAPDMADILATRFLKYQDPAGGLAGRTRAVRSGALAVVRAVRRAASPVHRHDRRRARRVHPRARGEWGEPIAELIRRTDFELSYVWNTSDLDPLPSLHGANAVLIGDAAHPFLPFTSQGVNAALADVRTLGACLVQELGAGRRASIPSRSNVRSSAIRTNVCRRSPVSSRQAAYCASASCIPIDSPGTRSSPSRNEPHAIR